MQFRTEPRKLPAVLSISCGAGLRAFEVCNPTTGVIDSDRMQIHIVRAMALDIQ
jgi:integrase/recombinase XerD